MQIKLIPAAPHPTILFNVSLHDPPEHLGIPPAWAAQLHRLGREGLECPQTMLALDKTTWLIACLTSVTFNLSGAAEGLSEEDGGVTVEGEEQCSGRVTCLFIDGKVVEWELSSAQMADREALACVRMLEGVCRDVQDSATEAERERMRYAIPEPRSNTPTPAAVEEGNAQPNEKGDSKKQGKHKRQRSLLKSLVASLVSFQSPSQPPPAPQLPPPSPPQPIATPVGPSRPYSTSNLSTELRKRARSALVDAFRRFVLMRLAATILPLCGCVALQPTYNSHIGYFATWVAQSMLERVEAEMEALVHEAGGVPSVYMNTVVSSQAWQDGTRSEVYGMIEGSSDFSVSGVSREEQLVDEALPALNEADDAATDDSDGSSVHTPPDGMPTEPSPFIPEDESPSPPLQANEKYSSPSSAFPRSPSPPTPPNLSSPLPSSGSSVSPTYASGVSPSSIASSITITMPQPPQPTFSPAALTAYTTLSTHRLRLRNLLGRLSAQADMLLSEDQALQAALEIKGRRRAWSNREYMRKDSADMRFLGFAIPTRRSPLGLSEPLCASDVIVVSSGSTSSVRADGYAVESVNGPGKHRRRPSDTGLVVTTADHNIMRLFPVCEEDEEDEYHYEYALPSSPSDVSFTDSPSARLVEDSILRNAEAGLLPALAMQRHSVPVRSRTRSMIQAAPALLPTPPLSPTTSAPPSDVDTAASSPAPLAASLPEVEEEKIEFDVLEPQTKVELFDVYSGEEEEGEDASAEEMGFRSEFTLAMDLPPPYRMEVGVRAMTRGYDKWVVGHRTTGSTGH